MLPYKRTAEFFSYLFDHTISEGTINNINQRLYKNLKQTELGIKKSIIGADVIDQDETGIYVDGKRQWLHCSSTRDFTFYQNHQNRGHKAFDLIGIIPEFQGSLIHNYWRPYLGYANCAHYFCNAHHLRELKSVSEEFHEKSCKNSGRGIFQFLKIV